MDKQEAIKILKEFHDTSALFSVRTALETVFPELKESKDEKIRKALIKYCKLQQKANNIGLCGISLIDIIAWLEKQGEPIDDNIITRDDEILQAISIGLTDAVENFGWSNFGGLPIKEIQEWLEKQGEKKPIEWSKEDERIYYSLLADIRTRQDGSTSSTLDAYYNEQISWLKSLKRRMGE